LTTNYGGELFGLKRDAPANAHDCDGCQECVAECCHECGEHEACAVECTHVCDGCEDCAAES